MHQQGHTTKSGIATSNIPSFLTQLLPGCTPSGHCNEYSEAWHPVPRKGDDSQLQLIISASPKGEGQHLMLALAHQSGGTNTMVTLPSFVLLDYLEY